MTLYILDGHSFLYQLFHALPPMSSPQGEPVGAIFGFTKDLFTIIEKHQPDILLCAFDMRAETFRSKLFAEYKANRSIMPEDLQPQIESAKEILQAFNIPILGVEGFEADDILASVACQTSCDCVLVTTDKDCRQCIDERVSLYNIRKQTFYKTEDLLADWGVQPEQVVDFQAIVGDATDNVPGVKGIGQKGAAELMKQFGTLERVYENLDKIKDKKREYLEKNKDAAFLSRKLVRLKTDVSLTADIHRQYTGYDSVKLQKLFERFGFKSLMTKLSHVSDETLALAADSTESPLTVDYRLIDTQEKFQTFYEQLKQQTIFSFDTETVPMSPQFDATMPRYTNIVGLSFCWNENEAFYLPFRGMLGSATLNEESTLEILRPLLENPEVKKVGQNIKYDIVVLANAGVRIRGVEFDTMIADYVLEPEQPHNLDALAERYLGHKTIKIEKLIGTGKKQKRMDEVPVEDICDYAAEDAWVTWMLYGKLKAESRFWKVNELPLVGILADMEINGITVEPSELTVLSEKFAAQLQTLEQKIYSAAGHLFNAASPKQLAAVLFDELALPIVRKTKTGASTDNEVLEELALLHPLPKLIIEYRQLAKLKGTYVDALPELIHPQTRRIHTSFNQTLTATGRLSSSNPNLQNIPVRSDEGKAIRHAFKPGTGFDYLLSCDYSQIELRVLAHFSGDKSLCEAFHQNEDIHSRVAAEVFGVEPASVTSAMRRTAKAVNFGVVYGQTAFGLSKQLGIDRKEAQHFIDGYFERYSGIKEYIDTILNECIARGYVETLLGHRRYFHSGTIRSYRNGDLNQAERMAVNTVIQGTAADLMKQAMCRLKSGAVQYPDTGTPALCHSHLLLQIHDELVFEVKKAYADELKEYVVQTMLLDQPLNVPLVVDAELTACWE